MADAVDPLAPSPAELALKGYLAALVPLFLPLLLLLALPPGRFFAADGLAPLIGVVVIVAAIGVEMITRFYFHRLLQLSPVFDAGFVRRMRCGWGGLPLIILFCVLLFGAGSVSLALRQKMPEINWPDIPRFSWPLFLGVVFLVRVHVSAVMYIAAKGRVFHVR
jgi:hypothetical protein